MGGGEWDCAFAVRRTAGPARWAFGPPPERAARTRQNWGGELGRAFATRRVAQFATTLRGGVQLVGARCTHRCGELPTRDEWVVLLRLVESRGPKPPAAEARNSRCRGPRRLRPLELRASSAPRTNLTKRSGNGALFLWVGRPGGTATLDAQAACCGPTVGRRPARAVLRTAINEKKGDGLI